MAWFYGARWIFQSLGLELLFDKIAGFTRFQRNPVHPVTLSKTEAALMQPQTDFQGVALWFDFMTFGSCFSVLKNPTQCCNINCRQLRGEVYNLVLFSRDGKLDRSRLRLRRDNDQATPTLFQPLFDLPYEQAKDKLLAQFQQKYFREHIRRTDGNITRVAEATGVNRTTIYRILGNAQAGDDDETQ